MADCTCELLMHYSDCEYDGPDIGAEDVNALRAMLERWASEREREVDS